MSELTPEQKDDLRSAARFMFWVFAVVFLTFFFLLSFGLGRRLPDSFDEPGLFVPIIALVFALTGMIASAAAGRSSRGMLARLFERCWIDVRAGGLVSEIESSSKTDRIRAAADELCQLQRGKPDQLILLLSNSCFKLQSRLPEQLQSYRSVMVVGRGASDIEWARIEAVRRVLVMLRAEKQVRRVIKRTADGTLEREQLQGILREIGREQKKIQK